MKKKMKEEEDGQETKPRAGPHWPLKY